MSPIKLCRLRAVLEGFDDAGTVIRRCREAGLLPHGGGGRNGVNSARLDARHVAMTLLAVASTSWCDPIEAPREAERLADFKLRGRDERLIDVLAGSIAAAAGSIDGYVPDGWAISRHEARQKTFGLTFHDNVVTPPDRVARIPPGAFEDIASLFRAAA